MDLLATVADLRTLLKEDSGTLTDDEGELLLGLATGAVQAAAAQQLVSATESVTLVGTCDQWFDLPQQPVTAVAAVSVDGVVLTVSVDYKRFGARLWRRCGWAKCPDEPSEVAVTYTHGYADWDDKLALARQATLTLASKMFTNPIGAIGMSIDDYRLQFGQSAGSDLAGIVPETVRRALRRTYGKRGRFTRVG